MKSPRKKIQANVKLRTFKKDDYRCIYCGVRGSKTVDLTVDHLIPLKHGGKNKDCNYVTSCVECNENKGHMLLTQFIRAYDIKVTRKLDSYL